MPAKIAPSPGAAPTPAAQPTQQAQRSAAPPPPASRPAAPPAPRPQATRVAAGRDDEGVARQAGDSTEARASSDPYPKWDSFTTPWASGTHVYLCSVQKIVKWPFGTMLTFRVEQGHERGRSFDWGQNEPKNMDSEKLVRWRSNFYGAYAAGGWPLDADAATGWPGWERNAAGITVPPYDQMFVHRAPDDVLVPVILRVETWTGNKADSTPFVNTVQHYIPMGESMPVQAPMPYHLPAWLANANGWSGTPDSIPTGKYGPISVVKMDYKQIPFNHGGLKTMRDLKG